ncbi:FAD:protein FMN transferase [Leptobacterium flavescens]|uniref:FAD:protein FMN transferase n=1 Tax=Leptobacterium flavescens TaxID=472055 RepID=A0A6P0UKL0_9FLAO|nr:FAD:protein FMN transferase [Leptobacterium flavescens]NER12428.1 FAD:protein FMN transferase [Leptobacterium flavescens]
MWSDIVDLSKSKFFSRGLLLISLFLFISCKKETSPPKTSSFIVTTGFALGTSYSIKYEKADGITDLQKEIEDIISKINKSMSTYIPTSDISRVNKGDSTVVIDSYFREVFLKSREIWEKTDGSFDPTVGSLVNAWGFGPGEELPNISPEQVDSIMEYVGFDKLKLTQDQKIRKKHPEIYIDFNAVAKGYTIDLIGRLFDDHNIENYLIELGGEILTKGRNTELGKDWILGIDDPRQESTNQRDLLTTIRLKNQAMATSGNYRKFRIDPETGEKYVHTVNPKTGYTQKSNVLSVSVVASTCMEADAYATAFMAMELEKTKALLTALHNIEVYIILAGEGDTVKTFATEGFTSLLTD